MSSCEALWFIWSSIKLLGVALDFSITSFKYVLVKTFNQYNNLNFLLRRQTVYQENGRLQSEEKAIEIDNITQHILESNNINYFTFTNNDMKNIMNIIKGNMK